MTNNPWPISLYTGGGQTTPNHFDVNLPITEVRRGQRRAAERTRRNSKASEHIFFWIVSFNQCTQCVLECVVLWFFWRAPVARISTSVFSPLTSRFLSAVTSPLAVLALRQSGSPAGLGAHGELFSGGPTRSRAYSSPSVFADDPVNGHLRHFLGVAELLPNPILVGPPPVWSVITYSSSELVYRVHSWPSVSGGLPGHYPPPVDTPGHVGDGRPVTELEQMWPTAVQLHTKLQATAAKSSELEKAAKIHFPDSVDSQCSGDRDWRSFNQHHRQHRCRAAAHLSWNVVWERHWLTLTVTYTRDARASCSPGYSVPVTDATAAVCESASPWISFSVD